MNYLDALDWLRINYPKYDLSDRIQIINLAKGGGPYIGPKGGKWTDPQHTIPWKEETVKREPPGSQLPENIQQKLKELNIDKYPQADIPISQIKVDLSGDINSKAVIAWRDSKGKIQTGYTPAFHKANAEKKWKRVQAFRDKKPKLISDINDKLTNTKKGSIEHQGYTVLSIIAETGLRPGSTGSLKKHGHYGIGTLTKDHVKVENEIAVIQFVGKAGKKNTTVVKNPKTVESLKYYLGQNKDSLFQPSALDNAKEVMPKGMKVKDLRTIKATETAEKYINGIETPPPLTGNAKKDKALLAKALFNTSKAVSTILNNTPSVAKASYIHPSVFEKWANKIGANKALWAN